MGGGNSHYRFRPFCHSPNLERLEHFETDADYRMPYSLSRDYWLYERRLERVEPSRIVLLGDSVIWGEYVLPDGTLSHFLNEAVRPEATVCKWWRERLISPCH